MTLISPARRALLAMAGVAATSGPRAVLAQTGNWPAYPIRLIVTYGAGGSLDQIGRLLAKGLSEELKQAVVVENVPGGDGTLGVRRLISAPADGYTLLVGITSTITLAPLTSEAAKYTPDDLAAVAKVCTSGIVLAGRPSLKANNLAELITLSRNSPQPLTFGSPGVGSFQHLSMESLSAKAKMNTMHVPYNAAAQIATDVMGGHLDLIVAGLPSLLQLIDSGKLRAYAVMSHERDIGDSKIPAAAETPGLSDVDFDLWTGIFAPKGTPAAIVTAANKAIEHVLARPDIVAEYRTMGVNVTKPSTPAQFTDFVHRDSARLQQLVAKEGLTPK